MKKVYLATPVGDPTDFEIRDNAEGAEEILRELGFDVYCPWEMKIPHAWDYTNQEWGLMVFTADLQELQKCDLVVVLSYGRTSTYGTAWEQGFAYARGKYIIVVEMNDKTQSLMISNGCYARVDGLEGLKNYDFEKMPKWRTNTEQK